MGDEVPLYASAYAGLDVRERVRRETYGEDLGQSSWMTVDELERFGEWLELHAGSRLLDVGCGSGGPVLHLAEATHATVVGVDVLQEGIAAAAAQAQARGLTETADFVRADAGERLPFEDESFDAAASVFTHTDVSDFAAVLRETARVLRPGGQFVYLGVHPCFVGPHAFVHAREVPELHPGYRDTSYQTEAPGIWREGLRAKVGATHLPLGLFLNAFLAAGFRLEHFEEPEGAEYPYILALRARR